MSENQIIRDWVEKAIEKFNLEPTSDETEKLNRLLKTDVDWRWEEYKKLLEQSLVANKHILILIKRLESLDKTVACNGCEAADLCRLGRPCGFAWNDFLFQKQLSVTFTQDGNTLFMLH